MHNYQYMNHKKTVLESHGSIIERESGVGIVVCKISGLLVIMVIGFLDKFKPIVFLIQYIGIKT